MTRPVRARGYPGSAALTICSMPVGPPYDIAVVGAGILGLATARELLGRHPGLRLAVIDREAELGAHQTGHNSGVVHAGIYYAPGSLKARLCVDGAAKLYAFCERHDIAVERCGKLIVALDAYELERPDELERRGRANGVPGPRRPRAAGVRGGGAPPAGGPGPHPPPP